MLWLPSRHQLVLQIVRKSLQAPGFSTQTFRSYPPHIKSGFSLTVHEVWRRERRRTIFPIPQWQSTYPLFIYIPKAEAPETRVSNRRAVFMVKELWMSWGWFFVPLIVEVLVTLWCPRTIRVKVREGISQKEVWQSQGDWRTSITQSTSQRSPQNDGTRFVDVAEFALLFILLFHPKCSQQCEFLLSWPFSLLGHLPLVSLARPTELSRTSRSSVSSSLGITGEGVVHHIDVSPFLRNHLRIQLGRRS